MKWPWSRRETDKDHDVEQLREHEEIDRRLTLLESSVKVLKARAQLQDQRGQK